ncbi:MAG: cache domain-containing protein [Treponema sp.]
MKRFVSIRMKMMIWLVVCIVSLSLAICVIIGVQMHRSTLRRYNRFISRELFTIDKVLTMFIENAGNMAKSLANQRMLQTLNSDSLPGRRVSLNDLSETDRLRYEDIHNMFITVKNTYPEIVEAFMGTKWGNFLVSDSVNDTTSFDPTTREWYQRATQNPDNVILTQAYFSHTKEPVITFAKAIKLKNNVVGVVGLDVSLSNLDSFMESIKIGKTGYCLLLQNDGTILVDPKHSNVIFKNIKDCGIP